MRALVTGGAGQIGSHIVDRLLARGFDVTVLDSLDQVTHPRGRPPWLPHDVRFVEGDVTDEGALRKALEGARVVFHEAAYQGLLPDFSRFFRTNSGGTALIYELIVCDRLPVEKVVVASSQAVYGEGRYECVEHGAAFPPPRSSDQLAAAHWEHRCPSCGQELQPLTTNEERVSGTTSYAVSKHSQEEIALGLGRTYGIPSVALRYAITFGPRQSFHNAYSGLSGIVAQRVLNGRPVVVYEDGRQTRDIVFAGDVADANLFVMERPEADYQVFNVGTGSAVSVVEFVGVLSTKLGHEPRATIPVEFRLGDVRHLVPDVSRLAALGWRAKTSLEDAAKAYAAWIVEQPEVPDNFHLAELDMKQRGVIRKVARAA